MPLLLLISLVSFVIPYLFLQSYFPLRIFLKPSPHLDLGLGKHNLKAAQDRQKIYADKHRVNREFNVGDHVYFRVREKKSSLNLGSCAKLSPRYCGQFEVLERIGPVA